MITEIYIPHFYPEGWEEDEILGYFTTEKKAWEACLKAHDFYKSYRFLWRGDPDWRYEFHYNSFSVRKVELDKMWAEEKYI